MSASVVACEWCRAPGAYLACPVEDCRRGGRIATCEGASCRRKSGYFHQYHRRETHEGHGHESVSALLGLVRETMQRQHQHRARAALKREQQREHPGWT